MLFPGVPSGGFIPSDIHAVVRAYISPRAELSKLEVCRLNTNATTYVDAVRFDFPTSALTHSQPIVQNTPPLPAKPGDAFNTPPFTVLLGVAGACANPDCVSFDQDGDGNPGVTVNALLQGVKVAAYVGIGVAMNISGTVQDATHIIGNTTFSFVGQIFGGTVNGSPFPALQGPIGGAPGDGGVGTNIVPFVLNKASSQDVSCATFCPTPEDHTVGCSIPGSPPPPT